MTGDKYVNVSLWQSTTRIHIRNYLNTNGSGGKVLLPTKKGVALTIEEWKALKANISEIDAQIVQCEKQRASQQQTKIPCRTEAAKRPESLIPEESQFLRKMDTITNTFGQYRDAVPFKKMKDLEPFDQ